MSFLKEVGFINVVQVPSNDGEDLLSYVLTSKCLAALVQCVEQCEQCRAVFRGT